MAEMQQQGVMAMVKIDGDKVKLLREQKGLTQLYVATVVQVTTDTISRWENKRYPAIKKENGLRLAEALEVDLEEILKIDEEPEEPADSVLSSSVPGGGSRIPPLKSHLPLLASVFAGATLVIGVVGYFFLYQEKPFNISAKRFIPLQCTAGQPFPVAIEVAIESSGPLAVIVKEQLPKGMTIKTSEPPLPSNGPKNSSLKWLKKAEGKALFTYIATLSQSLTADRPLNGSVATGNDGGKSFPITGPSTIQLTTFHWADSDGDNIISDQEILTVYDQYGDLEKLGIDVDLIEEIWLGSGYRWNEKKKTYEILP